MLRKSAAVSAPQAVQVKRSGPTDNRTEGSAVVLAGSRCALPGKWMIVMTPAYCVLRRYLHRAPERPWPGRHRYVSVWYVLSNGKAVGFNENPVRGWSFPVITYPPYQRTG